MQKILSSFNPWSSNHRALEDFEVLKENQKQIIVITTLAASLLTLPLLGLGGVIVFRLLVKHFNVSELTNLEKSRRENPALALTAKKTQQQYIEKIDQYFLEKKKPHLASIDDNKPFSFLDTQRDTFFEILDQVKEGLDQAQEEVPGQVKKKDDRNTREVMHDFINETTYLQVFYEVNVPKKFRIGVQVFKQLVLSLHSRQFLAIHFPTYTPDEVIEILKLVNLARCDFAGCLYKVKFNVHDIEYLDKTSEKQVITEHLKSSKARLLLTIGKSKGTVELVLGTIQEDSTSGEPKKIFLQPRLLK
jgi:hypothetical protein